MAHFLLLPHNPFMLLATINLTASEIIFVLSCFSVLLSITILHFQNKINDHEFRIKQLEEWITIFECEESDVEQGDLNK